MTDSFSPAAQAVLTAQAKERCLFEWSAVNDPPCHPSDPGWNGCVQCVDRRGIAAALQAAADEVVPVEPEPPELPFPSVNDPWPRWNANQNTRQRILAIAAELQAKALPGPALRGSGCDKTSTSIHQ